MNFKVPHNAFNPIYKKHIFNQAQRQVFFGGSSAGKSKFIPQRAILDILQGGRNYMFCRQVARTLRGSCYNEIVKTIQEWKIEDRFRITKSPMEITCDNGYQITFQGLDDVEKVKSITPAKGILTDIVIEEATETAVDTYKQLERRMRGVDIAQAEQVTKRITLLFNPILRSSWIYKEFFADINWQDDQTFYQRQGLTIQHATHKDNMFLTQEDRDVLENETDQYYYDVYTLGKWGTLEALIFKPLMTEEQSSGWKVLDFTDQIPSFDNIRHGLDFGFATDPLAYNGMHYDKRRSSLYIFREFRAIEMSDLELSENLKPVIGDGIITCDSAEPKSIKALKEHGINARGAKKGPDSVRFGIKWLRSLKIFIMPELIHTRQEFELYHWKKNRATGEITTNPSDKNNHHIDDIRYANEQDMAHREGGGMHSIKGI